MNDQIIFTINLHNECTRKEMEPVLDGIISKMANTKWYIDPSRNQRYVLRVCCKDAGHAIAIQAAHGYELTADVFRLVLDVYV